MGDAVRQRPPAGGGHRRRGTAAVPLPPGLARQAGRGEVRPDARLRQGAAPRRAAWSSADLGREGMPLERACAASVRLLDLGYFRIGNDVYAEDNGSFGLTTLERRHVRGDQDRAGASTSSASPGSSTTSRSTTRSVIEAIDIMRRRRGGDRRLLSYKDGRSLALGAARARQRLRARLDRARGHRQGLPHLARDRAGGRRARRDRRAGRDQGARGSGRSPAR